MFLASDSWVTSSLFHSSVNPLRPPERVHLLLRPASRFHSSRNRKFLTVTEPTLGGRGSILGKTLAFQALLAPMPASLSFAEAAAVSVATICTPSVSSGSVSGAVGDYGRARFFFGSAPPLNTHPPSTKRMLNHRNNSRLALGIFLADVLWPNEIYFHDVTCSRIRVRRKRSRTLGVLEQLASWETERVYEVIAMKSHVVNVLKIALNVLPLLPLTGCFCGQFFRGSDDVVAVAISPVNTSILPGATQKFTATGTFGG